MKILLLNPDSASGIGLDIFLKGPPLSLMCIAGAAPDHEYELLDLKFKSMTIKKLRQKIAASDIVAISSYTPSIKSALNLARITKNVDRNIITILGGYHASLVPEVIQQKELDIIVRGEGEITFKELTDYLEKNLGKPDWKQGLKDIKGIGFRKNGKVIITEKRPLVKKLDDLPFPNRDLVKKNKYAYFGASIDALESARGCPHDCNFCCVHEHWGNCWRMKSPERVLKEIATMRRDVRWTGFQDSEFTANMGRVGKIFDLIHEYGYDGSRNPWYSAQGRVDDIVRRPDVLKKMVDGGFKFLFIGIESIYQKSLDRIGKRIRLSQIKKAVEMLHDYGIAIFGSIIIGNIDETWDEVMQTANFAYRLGIDIMQFTPLTPLPATKLYHEADAKGWIVERDWEKWNLVDPIMKTPNLSVDQIRDAVALAYSRFYLGGREKKIQQYLPRKAMEYFFNKRFWWFFNYKMFPGFMLYTVPNVSKLVEMILPGVKREKMLEDKIKNLKVTHADTKNKNVVPQEPLEDLIIE
ncbi:MAG: B12-binding domain-containing radical SAM protein [Candidatus Hodarchaeota archaeon]